MTFDELYHQHKSLVFNLALSYVQNEDDAEEITQDVFVAAHRSMDSFRQEANHATWLYRITINKSLDHLKSRKRQKRFAVIVGLFSDDDGESKHIPHSFDHPGVALEQREAVARIFSKLNQLPATQRTALILSKIEDKSQIEIAEIMKLSVKAVESLLQRAKKTLRKSLGESE